MSRKRKKSSGKKRTRKRPRSLRQNSRTLVITFGFVLIVALSIYSITSFREKIRDQVASQPLNSSYLKSLIYKTDSLITEALFDLGITAKNISSKNKYKRNRGELDWEFKNVRISAPKGVTPREIKNTLTDVLPPEDRFLYKFAQKKNSLISEIEIDGLPTHRIRFDFQSEIGKIPEVKPNPDKPTKIVERNEATVKKQIQTAKKSASAREEISSQSITKPKIAIIVDDIGSNKLPIDRLLEIDANLSFAVLPGLPYSGYGARMANSRGRDVLLHLPMEPKTSSGYNGFDAGENALLVGFPKAEIVARLDRHLSSVPHIKGVNNHMGSKFTENSELMELVLQRINSKGLFFVDSRTSEFTTGLSIAKSLGMKAAERDVFLDNGALKGEGYVKSQIDKLTAVAKKNGIAIGIGHPHPETINALAEKIPEIKNEVDIVPISDLVK